MEHRSLRQCTRILKCNMRKVVDKECKTMIAIFYIIICFQSKEHDILEYITNKSRYNCG